MTWRRSPNYYQSHVLHRFARWHICFPLALWPLTNSVVFWSTRLGFECYCGPIEFAYDKVEWGITWQLLAHKQKHKHRNTPTHRAYVLLSLSMCLYLPVFVTLARSLSSLCSCLTHSFSQSFSQSLIQSLIHSFIRSPLTRSLTRSLTNSLTYHVSFRVLTVLTDLGLLGTSAYTMFLLATRPPTHRHLLQLIDPTGFPLQIEVFLISSRIYLLHCLPSFFVFNKTRLSSCPSASLWFLWQTNTDFHWFWISEQLLWYDEALANHLERCA